MHPAGWPVKKYILWFMDTPCSVILTRPLALQLAEILGDDTATWKDQKITLYPQPMNVAGRPCVALRARSLLKKLKSTVLVGFLFHTGGLRLLTSHQFFMHINQHYHLDFDCNYLTITTISLHGIPRKNSLLPDVVFVIIHFISMSLTL